SPLLTGTPAPRREAGDSSTPQGSAQNDSGEITRPMQRILNALASLEALGLRDLDKSNVAVFADQSPTSSGFTNNLGRLRTLGHLHYPQTGRVALTDSGRALAHAIGTIRTVE